MKAFKATILIAVLLVGFGCTHKISIKPMDNDFAKANNKISGECGICISKTDLDKVVTEGGSDKYQYTPYKDFQYGLGIAMRQTCEKVKFYENKDEAVASDSQVIIMPTVETNSDNSFWFWPPEDFTFTINSDVLGRDGQLLQRVDSVGQATAGNPQWMENMGYAGSRAMENAIRSFLDQLDYSKINNQGGLK